MQGRELISKMTRTYFILVTLIDLVIFVSGTISRPDERFGYHVFIMPLIYAFAGVLPQLVMYANHELSVKEVVVRKILQLVLVEILLNGIILGKQIFDVMYRDVVITISISIVFVFIFANVISWLMDSASARRLTKELEEFQKNAGK